MDYEKAYKDLIAKVKKAHLYAQTDSTNAVLEDILPELRESEDERIRKEIIDWMKGGNTYDWQKNKEKWIAYLEKQKEQKPAEWSEEDEVMLNELLDYCNIRNATRWYNWLISLRPQPKQEWSEEDEKMRNAILQDLANIKSVYPKINIQDEFNWLKSLRPQPHWKPSNLELGALRTAISVLTEERNFQRAGKHLQDILDHFEGKETRHDWKPSEDEESKIVNRYENH